jgi:hypothetical protein
MPVKRALLVLVLVVAGLALADWPAAPKAVTGCTREVVQLTAFIPRAVQQALADRGLPITVTALPYKRFKARAWVCPGGVVYPPRLAKLAEYFRPDLTTVVDATCSDATLCPAGDTGADDGGTDPFIEDAFECACSKGNYLADGGGTCRMVATGGFDAGNAPEGSTLGVGTFQGPGCFPKACGALFLSVPLPDGGAIQDTSWPPQCPGGL